jgi:hypothetical protein
MFDNGVNILSMASCRALRRPLRAEKNRFCWSFSQGIARRPAVDFAGSGLEYDGPSGLCKRFAIGGRACGQHDALGRRVNDGSLPQTAKLSLFLSFLEWQNGPILALYVRSRLLHMS